MPSHALQASLPEVLQLTAAAEASSDHPVAAALLSFAEAAIGPSDEEGSRGNRLGDSSAGSSTQAAGSSPKGRDQHGGRNVSWVAPASDLETLPGRWGPHRCCMYALHQRMTYTDLAACCSWGTLLCGWVHVILSCHHLLQRGQLHSAPAGGLGWQQTPAAGIQRRQWRWARGTCAGWQPPPHGRTGGGSRRGGHRVGAGRRGTRPHLRLCRRRRQVSNPGYSICQFSSGHLECRAVVAGCVIVKGVAADSSSWQMAVWRWGDKHLTAAAALQAAGGVCGRGSRQARGCRRHCSAAGVKVDLCKLLRCRARTLETASADVCTAVRRQICCEPLTSGLKWGCRLRGGRATC
jgi:hypothetical protein